MRGLPGGVIAESLDTTPVSLRLRAATSAIPNAAVPEPLEPITDAEAATTTAGDPRIMSLERIAAGRRHDPATEWSVGTPLASARNAHATNSVSSLADALESDANWLEGDLSLVDDELRMSHPGDDPADSLAFDDWLRVVAASGRGVKLDLKSSSHARIDEVLDQLRGSGIESGLLMVNVGEVADADLVAIRSALPDAWISLNPLAPSGGYDDEAIDTVLERARLVGGPISFALRWDAAEQHVIDRLAGAGSVSIWSNPWYGSPDDVESETRYLRVRGVDGMVDITDRSSTLQDAASSVRAGVQHVFGHDPYALGDSMRRAVSDLVGGIFD